MCFLYTSIIVRNKTRIWCIKNFSVCIQGIRIDNFGVYQY